MIKPTLNYEQLENCLDALLDLNDENIYMLCLQGFIINVNQSFAERKISVAERRELINKTKKTKPRVLTSKWKNIQLDETDYESLEEYPTDVIVRTMNKMKAINFVIMESDRIGGDQGENFYVGIAVLTN